MMHNMHKLYIFSLLIFLHLFMCGTAFSQKINIGLKGGINFSSLEGLFTFEQENITLSLNPKIAIRYTLGGVIRYNVTSNISVQTEVMVASRGARFKEDITIREQQFRLSGDVDLSYIEVPVLLRFSTVRPDRGRFFYQRTGFTFNIYAGGAAGYKTKANFNGSLTGELFGVPFEEPFKNSVWNQFDTLDYGIIIGGGFEFGIDTKIILDLRYYYGLTDIRVDQKSQDPIKNRMFSVLIGFII